MSGEAVAVDQHAERALIGGLMLLGDPRFVAGVIARGLRPGQFYWEKHGLIFQAIESLADRQAAVDPITICAELDRLGHRAKVTRNEVDELTGEVPAAGHFSEYADRVIELARWRDRQQAMYKVQHAIERRDAAAYSRAAADLDHVIAGNRTESFSADQWAAILYDFYAMPKTERNKYAIRTPFPRLTEALGDGLWRGEWLALSGPTNHGKSIIADQWLDTAANDGLKVHLYMTEMTALVRGMRYVARQTGVPFMRQRRRRDLTDEDHKMILASLSEMNYGCTIAADWSVDDIVRDALRARYDFVVVDLLHGFHYEDERGLDRLSKAMQRLARVSTIQDGHPGTAVVAVTHLKEEGLVKGKVPRPSIASIKGGSSIKQDADFVMFCWQENENGETTGEAETWLAKGRSGEKEMVQLRLNPRRFRFDLRPREGDELVAADSKDTPF